MVGLPADVFGELLTCVCEASLIVCRPSRRAQFERCVIERMSEVNCGSPGDYLGLLRDDAGERSTLIDRLTTKETYFFRLPGQFRFLVDRVLPELEERKSEQLRRLMGLHGSSREWRVPITLWSAACSTGEEAYSLAMAVDRGIRFPRAWDLRIHATDISWSALEKARAGVYAPGAVKSIPEEFQPKVGRRDDGTLSMPDSLRRLIAFRQFNLKELWSGDRQPDSSEDGTFPPPEGFDIIFCRNVMIYFDQDNQERLVRALHRILAPGGYLFTGDAELLHIYDHSFETVYDGGSVVYRKPADAE